MKDKSKGFKRLAKFILEDMRMSHIYQPVFIKTLLENDGSATANTIAKEILSYDPSQIEYYEDITKKMPAKVLKERGIIESVGNTYQFLEEFKSLTLSEARLLSAYCDQRLAEYLIKQGDRPFYHRKKSSGYIPGSIKYEVLKRAKSRCELCGVNNKDKALEVDHIIPRNKGGSDEIGNLQALCYSCNAMKRDTDDTDFRDVLDSYNDRESGCLFCEIPEERVVDHTASYFELGQPELNACHQLLEKTKEKILDLDPLVTGFNVGVNVGKDAGQTIFHCHIHLIPRRESDMENPKGGVRGVIPNKQSY